MKDAVLSIALELFYHHPNNHAQSGLQREVVLVRHSWAWKLEGKRFRKKREKKRVVLNGEKKNLKQN